MSIPPYSPVWPGPALLVPITLDALLVGTPNQSAGSLWAATGVNYANLGSLGAGVTPFAQKTPPPVGSHLLWTLPYALRSGTQSATGGEAGSVIFPNAPNRWAVLRSFVPPVSASSFTPAAVAPVLTAGILRSDSLHMLRANDSPYPNDGQVDGIGDYTPLDMWDGSTTGAPFLQAVGPGDVSWSAAYDNIRNVFAFHDDLSTAGIGFYTYQVIGWYADPDSDPLSTWVAETDWTVLMNTLGWGVGQDQENALPASLVAAAQAAWQTWQTAHGLSATGFNAAAIDSAAVPGQLAALMTKWGVYFDANGDAGVPPVQLTLPAQTLCHGSVLGVPWMGPNYGYESGAPSNGLSGPTVAVGNTPGEAVAAWMANWIAETTKQQDVEAIELALEAFQKGLIFSLGKDPVETAASLHAARFGGDNGGSQWVVVRPQQAASSSQTVGGGGNATIPLSPAQVAALRALNQAQTDTDTAGEQVNAIAWELWSCYFKLWFISANFLSGAEQVNDAIITLIGADAVNSGGAIAGLLGQAQAAAAAGTAQVAAALAALEKALAADETTAGFIVKEINNTTFSRPVDPVVLIAGSSADTKYAPPGTYGSDGFTFTRFTGQTLTSITIAQTTGPANPVTLGVADLQAALVFPAAGATPVSLGAPKEFPDLWLETLLADGSCSVWLAGLYLAKYQTLYQAPSPLSAAEAAQVILSQQTALWNDAASLGIPISALAAAANFTGVPPVPIALEDGSTQPWSPLFIDWEAEWHPTATDANGYPADWELHGLDYEWTGTQIPPSTLTYSGRTSIDPLAAQVIAQQLEAFVASDPDFDSLPVSIRQDLIEVKTYIQNFDFVTQSLSGFTNQLITDLAAPTLPVPADFFGPKIGPGVAAIVQDAQGIQPVPQDVNGNAPPYWPIRAGHFRFTNLWVVDAYGQVMATKRTGDTYVHLETATTVQTPGAQNADYVQLPPRFTQSTRLNLTMIDAGDDALISTSADSTSPICGWIMANHLDDSLMVYDALGNNLGSVIVIDKDAGQTGLRWDAVPGSSDPLGSAPDIQNPHLAGFVNALLLAGANGSDAMRELLDVIDAASWRPQKQGQPQSGQGNLAVLSGRPIALVRTRLNIDLLGDPMLAFDQNLAQTGDFYPPAPPPDFTTTPFSVRVGDESFSTNGALGYCLGDDYATFYSVSDAPRSTSALRRGLAAGNGITKALGGMAEGMAGAGAPGSYVTPGQPVPVSPKVESGGVFTDAEVYLTVFVDPAGCIPVVSGSYPVLYGNLPPGPVSTALANMQISFRTGPLLLPPDQIKMPMPSEINGDWAWMERESVTLWAPPAEPGPSDSVPGMADIPLRLREGWLVLSGSQKPS
ncbi:MAG: hypothetical protein V4726_06645 [Verrucomicrobiota bacterium]